MSKPISQLEARLRGAVLSLSGELDGYTREIARGQLDKLLDKGYRQVLIDVEHLRYVTPEGVNLLLKAWASQRRRSCQLLVLGARGQVRRMFELRGLNCILAPDVDGLDPFSPLAPPA